MSEELSFCDLRSKELINSVDGKKLGRIIDIVFSMPSGKIKGIVAPYTRKAFFFKAQDIFIPWGCVKKIGEDVILVEIRDLSGRSEPDGQQRPNCSDDEKPKRKPPKKDSKPDCDGRCEKCMLFDCSDRWKKGVEIPYTEAEDYPYDEY